MKIFKCRNCDFFSASPLKFAQHEEMCKAVAIQISMLVNNNGGCSDSDRGSDGTLSTSGLDSPVPPDSDNDTVIHLNPSGNETASEDTLIETDPGSGTELIAEDDREEESEDTKELLLPEPSVPFPKDPQSSLSLSLLNQDEPPPGKIPRLDYPSSVVPMNYPGLQEFGGASSPLLPPAHRRRMIVWVKSYKCKLCEYKTPIPFNLYQHMEAHQHLKLSSLPQQPTHHPAEDEDTKIFTCIICLMQCKGKNDLYRHLKNFHNVSAETLDSSWKSGSKSNNNNSLGPAAPALTGREVLKRRLSQTPSALAAQPLTQYYDPKSKLYKCSKCPFGSTEYTWTHFHEIYCQFKSTNSVNFFKPASEVEVLEGGVKAEEEEEEESNDLEKKKLENLDPDDPDRLEPDNDTEAGIEVEANPENEQQAFLQNPNPKDGGILTYSCSQCNQTFKHSYALSRHRKTHYTEKPHKCRFCNYATNRSDHLAQHQRSHITSKAPFSCDQCPYFANAKDRITFHKNRYHCQAEGEMTTPGPAGSTEAADTIATEIATEAIELDLRVSTVQKENREKKKEGNVPRKVPEILAAPSPLTTVQAPVVVEPEVNNKRFSITSIAGGVKELLRRKLTRRGDNNASQARGSLILGQSPSIFAKLTTDKDPKNPFQQQLFQGAKQGSNSGSVPGSSGEEEDILLFKDLLGMGLSAEGLAASKGSSSSPIQILVDVPKRSEVGERKGLPDIPRKYREQSVEVIEAIDCTIEGKEVRMKSQSSTRTVGNGHSLFGFDAKSELRFQESARGTYGKDLLGPARSVQTFPGSSTPLPLKGPEPPLNGNYTQDEITKAVEIVLDNLDQMDSSSSSPPESIKSMDDRASDYIPETEDEASELPRQPESQKAEEQQQQQGNSSFHQYYKPLGTGTQTLHDNNSKSCNPSNRARYSNIYKPY